MENLNKLESKLAQLYAKAPQLPGSARRWLGANLWWITLIYAILGVFGVLGNIRQIDDIMTRRSLLSIYLASNNSLILVAAVISLAVSVVTTILYFAAIRPLKDGRKLGWNLVLYGFLVGVLFTTVSVVLGSVIYGVSVAFIAVVFSALVSLAFAAVLLYFLFQVRGEFASRVANTKEAEVVGKTTKTTKSPFKK